MKEGRKVDPFLFAFRSEVRMIPISVPFRFAFRSYFPFALQGSDQSQPERNQSHGGLGLEFRGGPAAQGRVGGHPHFVHWHLLGALRPPPFSTHASLGAPFVPVLSFRGGWLLEIFCHPYSL